MVNAIHLPEGDSAPLELHAQVQGVVQGVGFRYHTRREARALAVTGYVKNEPDGSVFVRAQGRRSQLYALLQWLHHGPNSAEVSEVSASWRPLGEPHAGFEVR
ncbi:MAG: acylphosphatase [Anaerolineae bacterium]